MHGRSTTLGAWRAGWGVLGAVTAAWACAHAPPAPPPHNVDLFVGDARVTQQRLDGFELAADWELTNGGGAPATLERVAWTLTLDDDTPIIGEEQIRRRCPAGTDLAGKLSVKAPLLSSTAIAAASPSAPPDTAAAAGDDTGTGARTDAGAASHGANNDNDNDNDNNRDDSDGPSAGTETTPTQPRRIVHYKLRAMFEVQTTTGQETFESQWQGEVLAPRAPLVTLNAEAARYPGRFEVHFALGVSNPNPFPVPVEALDYKIFIGDVAIRDGQLAEGQTIGAGSEMQFDVTQFIGGDTLAALARQLASAEAIPYHIDNELRAAGLRISTPLRGEIRFSR